MYVRASYHILARRSSDFECQNLCKSAFFEAYLFHWSAFEGPGRRKPEYQACMYRLSQTSPCRENKGLLYRYTDKISAQIQILRGSQILRNSSKIPFLMRVTCCTIITRGRSPVVTFSLARAIHAIVLSPVATLPGGDTTSIWFTVIVTRSHVGMLVA